VSEVVPAVDSVVVSASQSAEMSAVVSASEANRSFSSLLRQVARGQRFTVLSHGRPVATIAPAESASGSRAALRRALLARLAQQPATGEPRSWTRDELYD
jgi:prevent-host-death family protein